MRRLACLFMAPQSRAGEQPGAGLCWPAFWKIPTWFIPKASPCLGLNPHLEMLSVSPRGSSQGDPGSVPGTWRMHRNAGGVEGEPPSCSSQGQLSKRGGPEDRPAVSLPEDPAPLGTVGALVHLRPPPPPDQREDSADPDAEEGSSWCPFPAWAGGASLWARVSTRPGDGRRRSASASPASQMPTKAPWRHLSFYLTG